MTDSDKLIEIIYTLLMERIGSQTAANAWESVAKSNQRKADMWTTEHANEAWRGDLQQKSAEPKP